MLVEGIFRRFTSVRGLLTIGVMLVVLGIVGFRHDWGFLLRKAETSATVLALETVDDRGITSTQALLDYSIDGRRYTEKAKPTQRSVSVGQTLEVSYDPENPADVRLMALGDNWLLPLWVIMLGGLISAFGARKWRLARAAARQ